MRLGFIGPLGDDIPSIFPVVAGVLLFFASIYTASIRVDERNNYISLKRAGIDIAYSAMITGKLTQEEFDDLCSASLKEVAKRNAVYFAVTIQDCCLDLCRQTTAAPGKKGFTICVRDSYAPFKSRYDFKICTNEELIKRGVYPKNFVSFAYPIAIPSPGSYIGPYGPIYFSPGIVNVVVWRGKIGEKQ